MFRGLVAVLLLTWGVNHASAGLLDAIHVRAKADAPLEADQPGFEVSLLDSHSDELLVLGSVRVPDSFGKVSTAALVIMGADGKKLGEVALAPSVFSAKTPRFEFTLARSLLQNSTVTLMHDKEDDFDLVVFHLGDFGVRDNKLPPKPAVVPKVRVVLAEQGVYDEEGNFTPTDRLPLVVGQTYGFRVYLRFNGGGSLPLRAEETLPVPPKTWGDAETLKQSKISEDGRTATFTVPIIADKLYENGGVIAEGDPAGDYVCKLFVRDELIKTFVFHVQPRAEAAPAVPAEKLPVPSP